MALFRVDPKGTVNLYKTYGLHAPAETHWRPATCAEVSCEKYERGWATSVLAGSREEGLLRAAAAGAVDGHKRSFVVSKQPDGFLRFLWRAGQPCLQASAHKVPLEREPIYVVRHGDWRGNPTGAKRRHANGDQWVEDFGENQQRWVTAIEKG